MIGLIKNYRLGFVYALIFLVSYFTGKMQIVAYFGACIAIFGVLVIMDHMINELKGCGK